MPRLASDSCSPGQARASSAAAVPTYCPGPVILEHLDPLTILETDDVDWDRALRLGMLAGI